MNVTLVLSNATCVSSSSCCSGVCKKERGFVRDATSFQVLVPVTVVQRLSAAVTREKSPPLSGSANEGGKASDWSRIQNTAF